MSYPPTPPVPLWPAFFPSAPVVPKLYYDALSPEQRIKKICEQLQRLCDYANELGIALNIDRDTLNKLLADFEKFIESGFEDYYEGLLNEYLVENFPSLAQVFLTNGVFFELSDDGYFVANVANQLNFTLDTISDATSESYGHLTITY